jgi:hypothetical protein
VLNIVRCPAAGPTSVTSQGLCLPGALSYIGCYIDGQGYLADVSYYSRSAEEELALCSSTPQQLSQAQLASIVRSVGEVITSIQVCSDSGGVRGLKFQTSLDQSHSCGQTSGSCSSLSGSGAALAGFGAVCGSAGALLRVQSITSPCWNRNYVQPTSPASECHSAQTQACCNHIDTNVNNPAQCTCTCTTSSCQTYRVLLAVLP